MLRKITSIQLAISFIILILTGIIMGVSNSISDYLLLTPFHVFSALIMVITGSIHLILNFKTFKNYFHNRYVKIVFFSTIFILALIYFFAMKAKSSIDEPATTEFNHTTDENNQIP